MCELETEKYIVENSEEVKKKLNLTQPPYGLNITAISDTDCKVEPIPPGDIRDGLQVSNKLLKEFIEKGWIRKKA